MRHRKIYMTVAALAIAGMTCFATADNIVSQRKALTYAEEGQTTDIAECEVVVGGQGISYVYTGEAIVPQVTVSYGGVSLVEGTDYTYVATDNVDAGTAKVIITGQGVYSGQTVKEFTINKAITQIKYLETEVTRVYGSSDFTNAISQAHTDATITYSSSNPLVATVDSTSGKVTIVGVGQTTITATAADGVNYADASTSYTLTVEKAQSVIEFSSSVANKTYGDGTFTNPMSKIITDGTITYSSTNSAVASVDAATGLVTIKKAGNADIYATISGAVNYTDTSAHFSVNVAKKAGSLGYTAGSIDKVYGDDNFTKPLDTKETDGTITYESSDTNVATVDETTGEVHIKNAGQTTITVRSTEGDNYLAATASYVINVAKASSIIKFPKEEVDKIYTDGTFEMPLKECITDGKLTYSSSNTNVATVDATTGDVTIVGSGKAIIKATVTAGANYGAADTSYILVVSKAKPQVVFEHSSETKVYKDEAFVNGLATCIADGALRYSSSNESVALVNEISGKVTIVGTGNTVITLTVLEGTNYLGGSFSYNLYVAKAEAALTFSKAIVVKRYGDGSYCLRVNKAVTDGDITYSSDDTSVALVDPVTGDVTIVGAGTAIITATSAESELYEEASASYELLVSKAKPALRHTVTKYYKQEDFTIAVDPTTTTSKVTYSSSNKAVAVVNETTGKVRIVGVGTTIIEAYAVESENYESAVLSYKLVVTKAPNSIVATNYTKVTQTKAQSFKLSTLHIKSGVDPVFKSNTKYVTVDGKGKVTIAKNYIGTAKITITAPATNHFAGATKTIKIVVLPKKPVITELTNSASRKLALKWRKDTNVHGYEIQYTTDAGFEKGIKRVVVKGSTAASKTLTSLSKGKYYYVQLRAYKVVGGVKYYSTWSAVSMLKVRK